MKNNKLNIIRAVYVGKDKSLQTLQMEKCKRYIIRGSGNTRVSYRHTSSVLLSKLTFYWVVDLLRRGYRAPLDLNDLGELPEEESTVIQFEKFRKIYEEQRVMHLIFFFVKLFNRNYLYSTCFNIFLYFKNGQIDGKASLWACYWRRIWRSLLLGGVLKFFGDATALIGPMAISKIVNYVTIIQNTTLNNNEIIGHYMTNKQLIDNGYFLGFVIFLAALLQSTLSQASTHYLNVDGIRLRTALQVRKLYKKLAQLTT